MKNVEVGLACGRYYLSVNGFVTAVEGDMCRDAGLPGMHWNKELLEMVLEGPKRELSDLQEERRYSSVPAINAAALYRAQKLKEREEHDTWVTERLKETFATVEASHHEMHQLWQDWSVEGMAFRVPDLRDKRQHFYWEQLGRGFNETIGVFRSEKESMPVVFSGFWARLRLRSADPGKLVLFWELCSQVTDSRMAERFLKENLPQVTLSPNADNFHHVAHAVQES